MKQARGVGLGKLILCGEHAVVFGHPALAFAVDRQTSVTLTRRAGPRTVDPHVDDPRLGRALDAVLPATGLHVQLKTNLPIGRGMGSSAALAVALARAAAALDGRVLDPDEAFQAAMPVETVFHGNPSGLDAAVASRGGFLSFRRGPPLEITPIAAKVPWSVVVLDTGRAGDTAALVAGVAARRPGIDGTLDRIGALVAEAERVLADPRALGEVLNENQAHLRTIGVSTQGLDALVDLARGAGAHGAKLSGAGGGGIVLALVDDPAPVLAAASAAGVHAFATAVGARP